MGGVHLPELGSDQAAIEQRRERVARLYCSGKSQRAVALAVGVCQTTVASDLQEIRKQWLSDAKMNFAERQAQELAKIDAVESEAWDAWERTKAEAAGEPIPEQEPEAVGPKKRVRVLGFTGEEKYLALVLRCVERRCRMLGLDAPDTLKLTGEIKKTFVLDPRKMTDDELDFAEQIANRRAAGDPVSDEGSDSSGTASA